jgi:hypothetical protein
MPSRQNDISGLYFTEQNLADRETAILKYIFEHTGFSPQKLLQKSAWWSSPRVGALHYSGTHNGEPVILKIQGVRPNVSETENIHSFEKQNKSTLVRPPKVFWDIPWNEELQFEALLTEDVGNQKLVHLPAQQSQFQEFFEVYREYRQNCLRTPWLTLPTVSLTEGVQQAFAQWQSIAADISSKHPLHDKGDAALIQHAVETLSREYAGVPWQFQHGHFSARDIFKKNGQYVVLSNLYWSWRAPYYDAVFGFHWYQFDLAALPNTSREQLNQHRRLWKAEIEKAAAPTSKHEKRLLELAFLERAAAGVNLDGLLADTAVTRWLMQTLRQEITELL